MIVKIRLLATLSGCFFSFAPVKANTLRTPPKDPHIALQKTFNEFTKDYPQLKIPVFQLDYRKNFKAIPDDERLQKQDEFFSHFEKEITRIKRAALSKNDRYDFDHFQYILRYNEQRIALERQFLKDYPDRSVPEGGLSHIKNFKKWFVLYVKKYTTCEIDPDSLYRFGLKEVAAVQAKIKIVQAKMGFANNDAGFYSYLKQDQFFLSDKDSIQQGFEAIRSIIYKNLGKFFYDTNIPLVTIKEIADADATTPPGFYIPADKNTPAGIFYYNNYTHRYNKRNMQWLFLHEGVPGHHYGIVHEQKFVSNPSFNTLFTFPYNGFFEGWAAYTEDLGKPLGLYQTNADYLGELEWDLVRSSRICIDVGINYLGWSKEKAIAYWKTNIHGQDEIAEREVDRCTNWVGQVHSYKVGKAKILELISWSKKKRGKAFDIKKFHQLFYSHGELPLPVVEEIIKENI